jgi:hypothetical protein
VPEFETRAKSNEGLGERQIKGEQDPAPVGRTTSAGEVRGKRYTFGFLIKNS